MCATLAPYLSAGKLAALRTGWTDWAAIVGTLNTAAGVPLDEIESFTRLAQRLVPPLPVTPPWLSVTPKLYAIALHALALFWRFGSLGAYGEQALQAWHGFFIYAQVRCTANSFLGACKRLVEQAALQGQPVASLKLDDGQRRGASKTKGARLASRPGDGRFRGSKDAQRSTVARTSRAEKEMCLWVIRHAGGACGVWMPSMHERCWISPRPMSMPMMSWWVRKRPLTRWQPWCERKFTSWFHVLCHGQRERLIGPCLSVKMASLASVPVALPLGASTVVHSLDIENFWWSFRAVREKKAIHANETLFLTQKF